jgi:regulator of nucleoside diphosphate kinase
MMMQKRTIYVTEFDENRLRELVRDTKTTEYRDSGYVKDLERELDRAVVVSSKEVPPDVVTMNSKIVLTDADTGEEMAFTLVFPQDADIMQDKISVLAPIGTVVLGYRVGDTFEWQVPDGTRRWTVKQILYQPESSGDYYL